MELVDKNLVVVFDRNSTGGIKTCTIHDILRELYQEKATRGNFCMRIHRPEPSRPSGVIIPYKQHRIFTSYNCYIENYIDPPVPNIHSLSCFRRCITFMIYITDKYLHSYALLTVLDIQNYLVRYFPQAIRLLIHLRYLAIWYYKDFPLSIEY